MSNEQSQLTAAWQAALREFMSHVTFASNQIVVLGCSSSEIHGAPIGRASNAETGKQIIATCLPVMREAQVFLAVQCCEHLNRALVIEQEAAERYGFERVSVIPSLTAGGACATAAYSSFKQPVMVEHIVAHAGIDIGDTEVGMHVKHVQVPLRLSVKTIEKASLTCLRYRPKYIGGERAEYDAQPGKHSR